MFQFPGLSSHILFDSDMDNGDLHLRWVPPFGYLRFVDCVRLHAAFRRFLRPSSALYA